ncbi:hypothetical protein N0V88_002435 [Collariella sp. IMI 366227]|nr:hypothetical protein N0V88_002435 [Collariella sp. IMI 366227]
MADHAPEAQGHPAADEGDRDHQTRVQRLRNETIDFTGEHRPDSPTDAVMNYQRAPAEQSSSSNTNQAQQPQVVGIDQTLIAHAVPARWDTLQDLMELVDFRLPQVCKFMGTCTLHLDGSEPNFRKAVSHIFGRNKSCTRQIPDGVFIVCCRKHYQRGRYRNAHEYAARMAGMVEIQVLRIQFWSNLNEMAGTPENGILRGWTIVLRRREQQRIEEATRRKASHPRANSGAGAEEELEDGDDEDADPSNDKIPQATSGGPVPAWLLAEVRSGHTTESIQIVVARIRTELENGTLLVFPDIEILPSIEGENAKPKYTKKAKEGKKASLKKPAGKQNARRQSDLDEQEDEDEASLAVNHKQQRRSHPSTIPGANALANFAPRNTGYTVPDMRPMQFPYGTTPSGPLPSPGFYNGSYHGADTAYRAKRPHQRSATMSWSTSTFQPNASTGGYNPPPRPLYPGAPESALAYDVPWNRELRNQGNADVNTSQPGASSAYSSSYGFQQPTDTSYYGYPTYPSSSAATHATDVQGGPPPTSAAKHMRSRNRSTPVMPGSRSTGFGVDAPQDGYNYDTTSFYGQVAVPRQQGYATTSRASEYNGQIAVPRGQPYHSTQSYPEAQQAYQPTQQYQSTQNGPEFTTTQTSNPTAPTGYEGYEGYDSRR